MKKIDLPGGNCCTPLSIHPKNWNQTGASVKKDWYIHYRFFEGGIPKLVIVKGMNEYKTLKERRDVTAGILVTLDNSLKSGYNPITKEWLSEPEDHDYIIHPKTRLIEALEKAKDSVSVEKTTRSDLRSVINQMKPVADKLQLNIPIKDIRRRHIIKILSACQLKHKWSDSRRNKVRAYLLILFTELFDVEAVESNIIRDVPIIKKIVRVQKTRDILSEEERVKVDNYLREHHYPFWLFLNIFFHSGARESEIMKLRAQDVNLKNQTFKVVIKKGREYREEYKTIKNIAVRYWAEALRDCEPNQVIFSKGLKPGESPIRPDQISRRWKLHVKDKLGVKADFYALKHLNSDEVDKTKGLAVAAALNSHESESTTSSYYTVGKQGRIHEQLKRLNNSFVPSDN